MATDWLGPDVVDDCNPYVEIRHMVKQTPLPVYVTSVPQRLPQIGDRVVLSRDSRGVKQYGVVTAVHNVSPSVSLGGSPLSPEHRASFIRRCRMPDDVVPSPASISEVIAQALTSCFMQQPYARTGCDEPLVLSDKPLVIGHGHHPR